MEQVMRKSATGGKASSAARFEATRAVADRLGPPDAQASMAVFQRVDEATQGTQQCSSEVPATTFASYFRVKRKTASTRNLRPPLTSHSPPAQAMRRNSTLLPPIRN